MALLPLAVFASSVAGQLLPTEPKKPAAEVESQIQLPASEYSEIVLPPLPSQVGAAVGGPSVPSEPVAKPTFDEARQMFDLPAEHFQPGDPKLAADDDEQRRIAKTRSQIIDAAWSLASRDLQSALSLLQNVKRELPKTLAPPLSAARYLLNTKQPAFRESARKLIEQAALDDRRAPEPAWEAACVAFDDERLADALAHIERYIQLLDGPHGEQLDKAILRGSQLQARVYARARRWKKVVEFTHYCLSYDADDAATHRLLGEALYRSDSTDPGRLADAFDSFQTAYRLADKKRGASGVAQDFPPPEMQMCRLAVELGHGENATRYAYELRRELPQYAQANPAERTRCGLFLAELFLLSGKASGCLEVIDAGKFSKDDLRRTEAIMGYFSNDPKAVNELSRLHGESPDDERISNFLARVLSDSEQTADRTRALQIAIANQAGHPTSLSANCTLAWAQLRSGDSRAAVESIRPIVESLRDSVAPATRHSTSLIERLNPDDVYLLAKVAFLDQLLGRTDFVITLLQKALKSTGPSRYRTRIEEFLDPFR